MTTERKAVYHYKDRVRWIDTDTSKRIHFAAMFRFFEIAEQEFFRSLGFTYKDIQKLGIELPRVNVECNYRSLIGNDELLDIEVSVGRVGNSSVTLCFLVRRQDGVVGADGQVIFATVDVNTGRSTVLPDKLRQELVFVQKNTIIGSGSIDSK